MTAAGARAGCSHAPGQKFPPEPLKGDCRDTLTSSRVVPTQMPVSASQHLAGSRHHEMHSAASRAVDRNERRWERHRIVRNPSVRRHRRYRTSKKQRRHPNKLPEWLRPDIDQKQFPPRMRAWGDSIAREESSFRGSNGATRTILEDKRA